MEKVAIITDSNSGITQSQAAHLGIRVLPMPFYIDDTLYFEDITLTQEGFYEKLQSDCNISTSQPAPEDVTKTWDEALQECDTVVHIPMSSGLSGSCQTAMMLAQDYDGRVQVVDNQRISVTMRQSVLDAMELARQGKTAVQIKEILEKTKAESSIFITLDTLKYLKKGGRITPAAAAIGIALNLKPILQIQGEKLDAYAKVRGKKAALSKMLEGVRAEMDRKFPGVPLEDIHIAVAYTENLEEALEWKQRVETELGVSCHMDPLSLSVACHIGPGALAVTCTKKLSDLQK